MDTARSELNERLEVAAEHATLRVPVAGPPDTAGDVRDALVGEAYDCVDDIAVLDGAGLVGIVPIERLLAADGGALIEDVMERDPPVVAPGADQEHVAWSMVHRDQSSVAVVDGDGTFAGLIPPHRMTAVLLSEHDEDLARLGGYLAGTTRARRAAEEAVAHRLWHRLPWLMVGLLGAMVSAAIIGAFEEQLARNVLLAVRAGIDPAFGSGPLASVVQDLPSIAVYFAIAVPLAG